MKSEAILVTGVSQRIGLHLANTFLDRGIAVIGTYRTPRPSIEALSNKGAELYQCDFYDQQQLNQLIKSIKNHHQSLRAIIHNASEWLPEKADLPAVDIMQRMMQIHVSTPYQLNLALENLLLNSKSKHADIIHIGDYVSSKGSKKHIGYAASKAAQDNLTFSFAAKLAPKVKVNSLAPALVIFNEHDDQAYRENAINKNLMQREAGLDEFQHAIDYLLASVYVTGRILPLDGGRHLK
jgi:dihydromonapterin reductase/dihydrofolate reductase